MVKSPVLNLKHQFNSRVMKVVIKKINEYTSLQTGKVITMPVPSSYNDITQDKELRDFIGWVWYDREVYVPRTWSNSQIRVVLRFESAHYNTIVVSFFQV